MGSSLILGCVIWLLTLLSVQGQMQAPDRFMLSGINAALHQGMFDQVKVLLTQLATKIMNEPLDTEIIGLLNLRVLKPDFKPDEKNSTNIVNWNLARLNFTNCSFNEATSTFSLIEPSQLIKVHFTDISFNMEFISEFTIDPSIFDYTERVYTVFSVFSVPSVTLYFSLNVTDNYMVLGEIKRFTANMAPNNVELEFYPERDVGVSDSAIFINRI
jgi:hypothetical protein